MKITNVQVIYSVDDTAQTIRGDVNASGKFDLTDIVTMQKWLLADKTVTLKNWKAGDLYEDGQLDVFDLAMMKRALFTT